MPRIKEDTHTLMADLTGRLQKLVDVAVKEGKESALAEVRSLLGGGTGVGNAAPTGKRRGRPFGSKNKPKEGAKPSKTGKKRKNPWANYTPEQKRERVRKLLAGRGLKPKNE